MPDNANPPLYEKDDGIFEIEGQPFTETRDLGKMATIIAGVAVGAMIGAGAALLLAPGSGEETRTAIRQRVRKLTRRERSVWKSLARAMEEAAQGTAARARLRRVKAEAAAAAVKAAT
ncbi:MAG: YtxH domain-containing protein [Gemmatimonadaceae bacterium]